MSNISTRAAKALFFAVMLPLTAAGCVTTGGADLAGTGLTHRVANRPEEFRVDAADVSKIDARFQRQVVDYRTAERPGTIVVDPRNRFLYLVGQDGKAVRYGVGVGRAGLEFTGTASVQVKKKWPRWTPTPAMIGREPARYAKWAGGMAGGEGNPLGARALYLFKGGQDTRFRIHGTTEPDSIGKAVSSGCIRMMNADVVDLYERTPLHTRVVVR
jgi:lipoprotein-anchoring transpeptidase ErfK/SrfK